MTTIRVFTVIAALATASVAIAAPPAKPPAEKKADKPAEPDKSAKKEVLTEAEAQKFVVFFDKLVGIAVANQDDCVKMASAVNAHIDANQALLKEANAAKNKNKELPPAVKEKLEKKAQELGTAITKKCVNDKGVQAAFTRMSGA